MRKVRNLSKVFRKGSIEVSVLDDITLSVAEGEYVAIMAPSGMGKSTFLNILGCLDRPTSGTYLLDGVPVQDMNDDELSHIRNKKIGFVFQSFQILMVGLGKGAEKDVRTKLRPLFGTAVIGI